MGEGHVWRFGYGSNIGLETLRSKKNLNPTRHVAGSIAGWELCFKPGIAHVEPGWAAVRPAKENEGEGKVHGSAFLIPEEEAAGLDRQERGYNVLPVQFVAYDGEAIEGVGLYVPKSGWSEDAKEGTPSLRYLRLLRNGAREAGLCEEWIRHLDSVPHYVTPPEVRGQTERWIAEFHADPEKKDEVWTAEELSKHDGSNAEYPAHVSARGYIVRVNPEKMVFSSWKGHAIERRNLLQFNGKSLDTGDIRCGEPGFRPLPDLACCSEEEKEFLLQNLESLLHGGGVIVARLEDFVDQNA
ncbi:hypothetical protein ACHAXT_005203 [Thalassiosira profunda]